MTRALHSPTTLKAKWRDQISDGEPAFGCRLEEASLRLPFWTSREVGMISLRLETFWYLFCMKMNSVTPTGQQAGAYHYVFPPIEFPVLTAASNGAALKMQSFLRT